MFWGTIFTIERREHRIMLIEPRTFCEFASVRFNADASRVSRLSYFKLLYKIASSIDAMRPSAKDSRFVVCSSWPLYPSIVEARRTPREAINYQSRARKEKEEDSRRARIDTFKSAHRLGGRRIPMRTGPGPQYLTEFIRHC